MSDERGSVSQAAHAWVAADKAVAAAAKECAAGISTAGNQLREAVARRTEAAWLLGDLAVAGPVEMLVYPDGNTFLILTVKMTVKMAGGRPVVRTRSIPWSYCLHWPDPAEEEHGIDPPARGLRRIAAHLRQQDIDAANIAAELLEKGAEDLEFLHATTWMELKDRREALAAAREVRP
jgi:hypothetical protein